MTGRLAVGLSLGLLLSIFSFGVSPCAADWFKKSDKRTLSINGSGEVRKKPDAAELHAAINAVARTAKDAMSEVSEKGNAMLVTATKHGIKPEDIQTGSISLFPVYERRRRNEPAHEPKLTGYRASLSYRVTSKQIKTFGELIDALVKAGVNNISGIRFYVTDHISMAKEARRRAIEDARRAAQVMAAAAGVKLGSALKIQDSGGVAVPRSYAVARTLRASSMPVAPGQVSARARVHIVFSIHD